MPSNSSTNLSSVSISNKAFMVGSNRFVIRGVAVSTAGISALGFTDVLADANYDVFNTLLLPALVSLNVNCIRVYQVEPTHSHQKAMTALAKAGIYVMVGLATSDNSVNQMTREYSYETYSRATLVVSEFQAYENTLCFSVGNEVEFPGQQASKLAAANPSWSATQVVNATIVLEISVALAMKVFARDIKNFLSTNQYRAIPVGCAMQDGPQSSWTSNNPNANQVGLIGTDTIATYYAAGSEEDRMDFIGINSYAYVPGGPMNSYDRLGTECSGLAVPAFLTESGGLSLSVARDWSIVPAMYTDSNVASQLSGQIAFELLEQGNGFGLYAVGQDSNGNPTLTATALGGLVNLQTQYATVSTLTPPAAASTPTPPTVALTKVNQTPPDTIAWLECSASITVENYTTPTSGVTGLIQILQMGIFLGTVGAALSSSEPTSQTIKVVPNVALTILAQPASGSAWFEVCGVAASNIVDGITVQNNVSWGSPCNISPS
jgi:hypothetical protein